VENAPFGIRSAKTAGCHVIAIRSYLADADLAGADVLLDALQEIIALL
jgi:beta-phosphoglucomutase-like phosphatase (HAD superfamily)